MPVLDTAALLHWPVERLQGGIVAHSQLEELRNLSPQRAMLLESIEMEWMSMGTGDAEDAAWAHAGFPYASWEVLTTCGLAKLQLGCWLHHNPTCQLFVNNPTCQLFVNNASFLCLSILCLRSE